jgi:hypothetical protein
MSTQETAAARISELIAELDHSPRGEQLRDAGFRRRHAYEALLRNPDPVMREIGQQLRDGHMRLSDILRVPAYAEAFGKAARQAEERLDPREIARQLEQFAGTAVDERSESRPGPSQERHRP